MRTKRASENERQRGSWRAKTYDSENRINHPNLSMAALNSTGYALFARPATPPSYLPTMADLPRSRILQLIKVRNLCACFVISQLLHLLTRASRNNAPFSPQPLTPIAFALGTRSCARDCAALASPHTTQERALPIAIWWIPSSRWDWRRGMMMRRIGWKG